MQTGTLLQRRVIYGFGEIKNHTVNAVERPANLFQPEQLDRRLSVPQNIYVLSCHNAGKAIGYIESTPCRRPQLVTSLLHRS